MARKTAMGKEPGSVSIALPESEKQRLQGRERRMPGKARPMDEKGNFTDRQPLERLSPGVYRNSQGKLVGSKGQALPKSSRIQNALQDVASITGQQANMQPAPRPGQQFSQQEMDAGIQAQNVANNFIDQYNVPGMGNQIQSGYLQAPEGTRFPLPMSNLMYQFPQGQQLQWSDLLRYPAGTPMPNGPEMQQMFQRQQQAQPNTVSGLLRRGR